jgi:hypothetical protein
VENPATLRQSRTEALMSQADTPALSAPAVEGEFSPEPAATEPAVVEQSTPPPPERQPGEDDDPPAAENQAPPPRFEWYSEQIAIIDTVQPLTRLKGIGNEDPDLTAEEKAVIWRLIDEKLAKIKKGTRL